MEPKSLKDSRTSETWLINEKDAVRNKPAPNPVFGRGLVVLKKQIASLRGMGVHAFVVPVRGATLTMCTRWCTI